MKTNKKFKNYLSNHPGFGKEMKPIKGKIDWIKYNFGPIYKKSIGRGVFLDIGPGLGETLVVWKELRVKDIYSIDISKEVVDYIKKIGFTSLLVKNTIDFLNKNKNKFGLINLSDVLEHIPTDELVDFVEAVFNALKPKGKFIIKTTNGQSPFYNISRYLCITHTNAFSEISFSQLLNQAGFEKMEFLSEKQLVAKNDLKGLLAKHIFTPLYFWWIRKVRGATFHYSPKILTQNIIAVAIKK